ncbi:hypothetical protein KAI68_07340 [bacterium]|nr:hypothetical protein [bacterium]
MEEEIDLKDYLNMIKKRWKIILGVFLSSVIVSVIISFSLPKVYEARGMLRMGKVREEYLETGNTVIKIFQTNSILEKVVKKLNLPVTEKEIEGIRGKIIISGSEDILEVKGRGKTPSIALELVDSAGKVILERHQRFFDKRKEILKEYNAGVENQLVEMEKDIKNIRDKIKRNEQTDSQAKAYIVQGYVESLENSLDRYNELKEQFYEKNLEESYAAEPTRIIVVPLKNDKPILPRKKINVLLAAFIGLIVGLGVAAFVDYLERSNTQKR